MNKKFYKKIICIFLIVIVDVLLLACANNKQLKKQIEDDTIIDWHEYDKLIDEIKNMKSSVERDVLLHKAEEMLMDQAIVIPMNYNVTRWIQSDKIDNVYMTIFNTINFEKMYYFDGRKEGNIFITTEPMTLDPGLVSDTGAASYVNNLFSGLIYFDANNQMQNALLDTYTLSNDGLMYNFKIKDTKWSDGKKLLASDFVYALKRNANPSTGAAISYILSPIEGYPYNLNVRALNDNTFQVKLSHPCSYFLSMFANSVTFPLREDIVSASEQWFTNLPMVTCGPYYLSSWNHKASMVYEKNPYYYNADNVKMDKVNVMINSDATSVFAAFNANNIDFATAFPVSYNGECIRKNNILSTFYILFNTKAKFFDRFTDAQAKKFRKAISYCIDREFMDKIRFGIFEKAYTLVGDVFLDSEGRKFTDSGDKYTYPYKNGYVEDINLDKARELLKEIGYHFDKNGRVIEDITFEMMGSTTSSVMMIMQTDLEKIGVHIKLKNTENAMIHVGDYTCAYFGWTSDYYDPLGLLELYTTNNENNYTFMGRDLPN